MALNCDYYVDVNGKEEFLHALDLYTIEIEISPHRVTFANRQVYATSDPPPLPFGRPLTEKELLDFVGTGFFDRPQRLRVLYPKREDTQVVRAVHGIDWETTLYQLWSISIPEVEITRDQWAYYIHRLHGEEFSPPITSDDLVLNPKLKKHILIKEQLEKLYLTHYEV